MDAGDPPTRRQFLSVTCSAGLVTASGCLRLTSDEQGQDRQATESGPESDSGSDTDTPGTTDAPSAEGPDWRQLGYNAANVGATPDATGPVESVTQRWTFSTGDSVESSPAVVDDTVYVGSNRGQTRLDTWYLRLGVWPRGWVLQYHDKWTK